LVEDDADTLATTLKLLEALGHWATGVKSAEAAIARFFDGAFDVVMVDIGLPALSGHDLAERLLHDHHVPVIFVTGYPERLLTGTQLEPAFVISKPFDPDLLRAAIAQALDTVSI